MPSYHLARVPVAAAHAGRSRLSAALTAAFLTTALPAVATASEAAHAAGAAGPLGHLPLWSAVPFVGILLSIALFPLLAPHFWHHHFPKVAAGWAALFAVPFVLWNPLEAANAIVHIGLVDYVPFLILIWGLYTIAGGIYVGGDLRGTPRVNALLLLVGTFLASFIGTTGAAMVMIRPLLRANAERRHRAHVVIFFIFLVANIGGALTPLGDPPLFLGFLHGVPFFWVTKGLLPHTLLAVALVLGVFYAVDTVLCRREPAAPAPKKGERRGGVRVSGLLNVPLLLGVGAAVVLSGVLKLPEVTVFRGGAHPVVVPLQNWAKDLLIIGLGLLSLRLTPRELRQRNGFSWGPIREVAILFAGIFITIIPALAILKAGSEGALAGLVAAVHGPTRFFWATGSLSAFLDNAPT